MGFLSVFIVAEMSAFGKKGDENPPRGDVGREVVLPADGKVSIIATRELPKARRLLLHLLSRKGKEVGVMTLYDVLLFMVLATGFMLAINKK